MRKKYENIYERKSRVGIPWGDLLKLDRLRSEPFL